MESCRVLCNRYCKSADSKLQVVEHDGPLFCLSWCKRKQWLFVGGKGKLHAYKASISVTLPHPTPAM